MINFIFPSVASFGVKKELIITFIRFMQFADDMRVANKLQLEIPKKKKIKGLQVFFFCLKVKLFTKKKENAGRKLIIFCC